MQSSSACTTPSTSYCQALQVSVLSAHRPLGGSSPKNDNVSVYVYFRVSGPQYIIHAGVPAQRPLNENYCCRTAIPEDLGGVLDPARIRIGNFEKQVQQRRAAIADHRRMTSALDACALCFASAKRAKHLTIAIGQTSYLALPERCDHIVLRT